MGPYRLAFGDLVSIGYFILSVIGLVIALAALIVLLQLISLLWSRSGNTFGSNSKIKLISLGIAAILFPSVITALVNAIITFVGNFFIDAPKALISNWQNTIQSCQNAGNNAVCLAQTLSAFTSAWSSAFSDALDRFGPYYLPYSQLILFLAVWAIVGLFLSLPSAGPGSEPNRREMWLLYTIERFSYATKQNILFFLIVILGVYLSVASIATIPSLQVVAAVSESVSVDRLDQQLTLDLTNFQGRMSQEAVVPNLFADLDTYFQANPTAAAQYKQYVQFQKVIHLQLIDQYSTMLRDKQAQVSNFKDSAVNVYKISNADRIGTQETSKHFLLIDAWFRNTLRAMESQVDLCHTSIINSDYVLQYLAADLLNYLQSGVKDRSYDTSDLSSVYNGLASVRKACQSDVHIDPIPERPDLGSDLGPFSFVASWLLRTESISLAQIVGLLGFGLLGSAVSSLIRTGPKRVAGDPIVKNLAQIVITGATAAVVVFLAVKGGLAILTPGESNPNSYVLLLICLVAAAFSEDVWQEAHKRFQKGLNDNSPQHPNPPSGNPPQPPNVPSGNPPQPQDTSNENSITASVATGIEEGSTSPDLHQEKPAVEPIEFIEAEESPPSAEPQEKSGNKTLHTTDVENAKVD